MSEADEMFEKLGYKKYDNPTEYNVACYVRYTPEGCKEEIIFHKNKHFAAFFNGEYSYIYFRELKAINKKVEELGWN